MPPAKKPGVMQSQLIGYVNPHDQTRQLLTVDLSDHARPMTVRIARASVDEIIALVEACNAGLEAVRKAHK